MKNNIHKARKPGWSPEDLSFFLDADLPTILAAAAASEIDRNEERLKALLSFLRHRILKLIRSREAILRELGEFIKTLERIDKSHLPRIFPWFLHAVKEQVELLLASEDCYDIPMAIKRHLPLSWEMLKVLYAMNGTPVLGSHVESTLTSKDTLKYYRHCLMALEDVDIVEISDYSYRLDRTFQLATCTECNAVDHVCDHEDPPRIPICGKCKSDMRVLNEEEARDIRGRSLIGLTDRGQELMRKVEQRECVF
jgi:hypothetical protein